MNSVEHRLRRPEDVEPIRALDTVYCRPLDDDWPARVRLPTEDGVLDGLSRVQGHRDPPTGVGGLADAGDDRGAAA